MRRIALALLALAASATVATAQIGGPKADDRVRRALEQLELQYTVNRAGAFEVGFALAGGRTQTAFVNSSTERYGRFEIREATSTAYAAKGPLPAALANRLLADNDRRKIGGWRTVTEGGTTYVIYAAQIAADADAESLRTAIKGVITTADELERELGGRDEF